LLHSSLSQVRNYVLPFVICASDGSHLACIRLQVSQKQAASQFALRASSHAMLAYAGLYKSASKTTPKPELAFLACNKILKRG